MDKFSAYNRMNSKGKNFPLALDGNSVRRHLQAGAENFPHPENFSALVICAKFACNLLKLKWTIFPLPPKTSGKSRFDLPRETALVAQM